MSVLFVSCEVLKLQANLKLAQLHGVCSYYPGNICSQLIFSGQSSQGILEEAYVKTKMTLMSKPK